MFLFDNCLGAARLAAGALQRLLASVFLHCIRVYAKCVHLQNAAHMSLGCRNVFFVGLQFLICFAMFMLCFSMFSLRSGCSKIMAKRVCMHLSQHVQGHLLSFRLFKCHSTHIT